MTAWLLDTNILSELRRPKPEPKVVAFVAQRPLESLHISVVTLSEIRFGIEVLPDITRRSEFNDWLVHKVRPMFDERILPIAEDVMLKWRLLVEEGRKVGHTFSQPDLIIAATAQDHICSPDGGPACLSQRAQRRCVSRVCLYRNLLNTD